MSVKRIKFKVFVDSPIGRHLVHHHGNNHIFECEAVHLNQSIRAAINNWLVDNDLGLDMSIHVQQIRGD